jgi:hypothetical protein
MDQDLRQRIGVILRRDGRAQAIIALRAKTGMPLPEANAIVDGLSPASDPMDLPGSLLDVAADFVINDRPPGERARIDEQSIGQWGEAQWAAAVSRARRLDERSYELCDRARNGEFSTGEVQARLRRECLGFSKVTYDLAFERGMIASR